MLKKRANLTQRAVGRWVRAAFIGYFLGCAFFPFRRRISFHSLLLKNIISPPKIINIDYHFVLVPWLAIDDLGAIAAQVFADPNKYTGRDLQLATDLQTINEVRTIYQEVLGKKAPHFPMLLFLFCRSLAKISSSCINIYGRQYRYHLCNSARRPYCSYLACRGEVKTPRDEIPVKRNVVQRDY